MKISKIVLNFIKSGKFRKFRLSAGSTWRFPKRFPGSFQRELSRELSRIPENPA
jgi:hypothetical protein